MTQQPAPPKVFISYSHDTVEHQERVLAFADRLRADGIDAEIDQYNAAPPEGWPLWCERQIEAADFVLMVCTETYHRRVRGDEERGKGLGVFWEARIIRQLLHDAGAVNDKFVPVIFSDASPEQIPRPIRGGGARYVVDNKDGYRGPVSVPDRAAAPSAASTRKDPPAPPKAKMVRRHDGGGNRREHDRRDSYKIFEILQDELSTKRKQIEALQAEKKLLADEKLSLEIIFGIATKLISEYHEHDLSVNNYISYASLFIKGDPCITLRSVTPGVCPEQVEIGDKINALA